MSYLRYSRPSTEMPRRHQADWQRHHENGKIEPMKYQPTSFFDRLFNRS